jgi:hypothetical protein
VSIPIRQWLSSVVFHFWSKGQLQIYKFEPVNWNIIKILTLLDMDVADFFDGAGNNVFGSTDVSVFKVVGDRRKVSGSSIIQQLCLA